MGLLCVISVFTQHTDLKHSYFKHLILSRFLGPYVFAVRCENEGRERKRKGELRATRRVPGQRWQRNFRQAGGILISFGCHVVI